MKTTIKTLFLLLFITSFFQNKIFGNNDYVAIKNNEIIETNTIKKTNQISIQSFQAAPLHNSFPLLRELNEVEIQKFETFNCFSLPFFLTEKNKNKLYQKNNSNFIYYYSIHSRLYLHLQCLRL